MTGVQTCALPILPAQVWCARDIPDGAKLLYGEITSFSNREGCCEVTNSYFSELSGKSKRAIISWVKALQNAGFIHCEYKINNARKIYLTELDRNIHCK